MSDEHDQLFGETKQDLATGEPEHGLAVVDEPAPPKHPFLDLVEKHFEPDSALRKFFEELHALTQASPGTDFWRGG
jgi:hypothetical protein